MLVLVLVLVLGFARLSMFLPSRRRSSPQSGSLRLRECDANVTACNTSLCSKARNSFMGDAASSHGMLSMSEIVGSFGGRVLPVAWMFLQLPSSIAALQRPHGLGGAKLSFPRAKDC